MQPAMYVIANPSLGMSSGKLAAQVAHAAVQAFRLTPDNNVKRMWDCGGHYTKIVLQADDLHIAERYLNDRGFQTVLIIDEGRTEFGGDLTATALGVEIVNKDGVHERATFGEFKLYRDLPKPVEVYIEKPMRRGWNLHARGNWKPGRLWYPLK